MFAAMAAPLEHYGIIGDTTTVALVSRTGSIDWLCMPRIDSDACFAQLLGTNQNGYWSVRPTARALRIEQRYREDTLVLETEFSCEGGKVRVIDFMTPGLGSLVHDLVRIVEGIEGQVAMRSDLMLRFGYGKHHPWIKLDRDGATLTSGPSSIFYLCPVPFTPDWDDSRLEADFTVRAGQRLA